jgi:hypothetical protein
MIMIRSTQYRVTEATCPKVNAAIERRTQESIARCAAAGRAAINRRLEELDREWDVERALELNFATLVFAGGALGLGVDRKYMLLPTVAAGFMIQHVLYGWCPPLPVLRRLGFRTTAEIDREKYALKALRGDFDQLPAPVDQRQTRSGQAWAAVSEA